MLLCPRNLLDFRLCTRRIKEPSLESVARLLRKRPAQSGIIVGRGRANGREDGRHTRCQSNNRITKATAKTVRITLPKH